MSTPLKALIQERLRAKMVCRRGDYEDYEFDADHLKPVDVTAYDVSSRRDDDGVMLRNTNGSSSRRSSLTQPSYPVRLHTHIDPSAYLVPSEHDDRYYPPSTEYSSGSGSHSDDRYYPPSTEYSSGSGSHSDDRHRQPRYSREQHREATMYELPHHPRDQRRHHHNHYRVREQLPPRYEPPSRGGYISRQPSENRTSVSPWHRSGNSTTPKSRSTAKNPVHTVPSHSPRGHRKQDYVYPSHADRNDYLRHRRDNKSTPTHHQDYHQHRRNNTYDHDYNNQPVYEVRDPSSTRHHDDDYPTFKNPARYSPVHSNQNGRYPVATTASSHKPQPEEINIPETTNIPHDSERHTPPQLDMKIIEPPPKTTGRTRTWGDIMSPESRLAAKAFVEKRQRRAEKSTPRTMATQRWLEVVDARASRYEAAAK